MIQFWNIFNSWNFWNLEIYLNLIISFNFSMIYWINVDFLGDIKYSDIENILKMNISFSININEYIVLIERFKIYYGK